MKSNIGNIFQSKQNRCGLLKTFLIPINTYCVNFAFIYAKFMEKFLENNFFHPFDRCALGPFILNYGPVRFWFIWFDVFNCQKIRQNIQRCLESADYEKCFWCYASKNFFILILYLKNEQVLRSYSSLSKNSFKKRTKF